MLEWEPMAASELDELRAFDSRPLLRAIEELLHAAEVETRNRKRLGRAIEEVPDAAWEVRVGAHRVFYDVKDGQTVRVLRVILKGRRTTAEAVGRRP
jgi:mRNA-degrading endonuclease RelE of RelBE toxin-antitoxin system